MLDLLPVGFTQQSYLNLTTIFKVYGYNFNCFRNDVTVLHIFNNVLKQLLTTTAKIFILSSALCASTCYEYLF